MFQGIPETKGRVCIKFRNNRMKCNICLNVCKADAIIFTESDIRIDHETCTRCMLCVSECPTGAIDSHFSDSMSEVNDLQPMYSLIVGCFHEQQQDSHIKTSCFGFLSESYFLGLIQGHQFSKIILNTSKCKKCVNNNILPYLQKRIEKYHKMVEVDDPVIFISDSRRQIDFRHVEYSRRSFFNSFRQYTNRKFRVLEKMGEHANDLAHGKYIPSSLLFLNSLSNVHDVFYYDFKINNSCDFCQICVGMCPTGALTRKEEDDKIKLSFNRTLCTGCEICQKSCPKESITIT